MKTTGIVRKFDNVGRVVIPKEIRERIWGTKNTDDMPVEFFLDGNSVVLKKYEGAVYSTEQEIRDKAIEEFAKRIKDVYPFTVLELEQLEEIAEQMKGGE